jgi:hypothetical protein
MNWIERMYEIKGKDLYSQNGEGLLLEYVLNYCNRGCFGKSFIDVGAGDGFNLSNTRHLINIGYRGKQIDKINGEFITSENVLNFYHGTALISIDTDGNDYWILDKMLSHVKPFVVIAEFNPAFTDSRVIKYNSDHVWSSDDYYGFSFEAGKKLAEKHGYEIIFNVANMNLIMVRKDLINVPVPPVTYKQDNFFKASNRPDSDWVWI